MNDTLGKHEIALMKPGSVLLTFLQPLVNHETVQRLADGKVTSFSMDAIPRTTRAQSMDALSSMSTIAGYKSVLIAANAMGRFFPLLMTKAGTVPPARAFVLGAGVAGLMAISTRTPPGRGCRGVRCPSRGKGASGEPGREVRRDAA